ncbi:MAG TPA: hypothetical protein VFY93_15730 [Planctomycetota bacterium]|nr:hypothetical protein [Planctomycetota bacterium]
MRRFLLPLSVAAAFLGGAHLARGDGNADAVRQLEDHEDLLLKDLSKIEQACKDVLEIRKMRESGEYVLNDEEKKMERQGREDFHIFMERFRNDTLEVLEILDAAASGKSAVDPLRRVYGKALDQIVTVGWNDEELDLMLGEISQTYGVPINIGGEMDRRRTMSLSGEMSLLSILLQIENVFEGKFIVREGQLWLVLVPPEEEDAGGAGGTNQK